MMGQLIGEKVVTVRRVAGYVVGAIAASMILGVGGAVAGVLDEPEQRADSLSLHSVNETLPINLKSADGREICVQVSRRLSDRMIPFLVEYELEDGEGLAFTWDLNDLVDSDLDGQFRNDADAIGKTSRMIYPSNRTPYIVTLWAEDEDGTVYRGEDEISFNAQNGDEILLDAEEFVPGASSVEWSSFNGDAEDNNVGIEAPNQAVTTISSTYPGVTTVTLKTYDDLLNPKLYDTTLYVFNKNPGIFKQEPGDFQVPGDGC